MKYSKWGGGVTQGYTQGGIWCKDTIHGHLSLFCLTPIYVACCFRSLCKIKSKGNYNHFIVRQVALLGVSDNCVNKKIYVSPVHMNIYIFKFLWAGFQILQWISKRYLIKITPID